MRTSSPLLLILLPLSLSCSEYEFIGGAGEAGGGSDTAGDGGSGGSGLPGDCGDFDNYPDESVDLNDECDVELSEGSFTPVVEWQYGSSAFCGPPVAGQIVDSNSNGALDSADMPVIVLYQSNKVIAIYGDGSGEAWRAQGRQYGQDGGFAIGDVDEDGWPDVITASSNMVCALDGNSGTELWCATGLSASLDAMGYSYPSISDLNADGHPEVIVGSAIMRGSDGTVLGQGTRGIGAAPYGGVPSSTYGAMSAAVDLDGDGNAEVITGNAAYDHTGAVVWSNTGLDGLVAVADFDGDGEGEIVKTSGIYVTGMESDGSEVWGPLTYSGNLGAPAVDDLDGDGTPDFVFAAQNKLIAMAWGGTVMWQATISDSSGAAGPTLFDFEMDGYPEVLYADEQSIQFFSGLDGSVKFRSTSHASYTILETPIVADVDNDGQVEIVLGHCQGNASIGAITIYGDADESWPQGRKVWNQHGYQITNIDDDGSVPSPTNNNWPVYNSFRSGDVGAAPSEYWDLRGEVVDVCEEECDRGNVYVIGRVRNAGNIEAPAGIQVSLRAGGGGAIIGTAVTTRVTAPGETGEILSFTVASDDIKGERPVVTADEDASGYGTVYECDESNNAGSWTEAVCE
jgi:hypothetical protein